MNEIWYAHVSCPDTQNSFLSLEFLLNALAVVTQQTLTFRHEAGSCCSLNVHCPTCTKFFKLDKNPVLNTSTCQY